MEPRAGDDGYWSDDDTDDDVYLPHSAFRGTDEGEDSLVRRERAREERELVQVVCGGLHEGSLYVCCRRAVHGRSYEVLESWKEEMR